MGKGPMLFEAGQKSGTFWPPQGAQNWQDHFIPEQYHSESNSMSFCTDLTSNPYGDQSYDGTGIQNSYSTNSSFAAAGPSSAPYSLSFLDNGPPMPKGCFNSAADWTSPPTSPATQDSMFEFEPLSPLSKPSTPGFRSSPTGDLSYVELAELHGGTTTLYHEDLVALPVYEEKKPARPSNSNPPKQYGAKDPDMKIARCGHRPREDGQPYRKPRGKRTGGLTEEGRKEAALCRQAGACDICRASKRKCTHYSNPHNHGPPVTPFDFWSPAPPKFYRLDFED